MEPWYKVGLPRAEVREGRSFNPNEFAIALEQVVAGRGPGDYRDPQTSFARMYFTPALRENAVLRPLAGHITNAAPQFGGGKTQTLTALYHLVKHGSALGEVEGVSYLLRDAGLAEVPQAAVALRTIHRLAVSLGMPLSEGVPWNGLTLRQLQSLTSCGGRRLET